MPRKSKYSEVKVDLATAFDNGRSELQDLSDEMASWRDSMEEKFSSTDKYQRVSDAADNLENALSTIPDELGFTDTKIMDIEVSYQVVRKRKLSRAMRCSNACAALGAVAQALSDWADANPEHEETHDAQEAADSCQNGADEAEQTDFPGMYG